MEVAMSVMEKKILMTRLVKDFVCNIWKVQPQVFQGKEII